MSIILYIICLISGLIFLDIGYYCGFKDGKPTIYFILLLSGCGLLLMAYFIAEQNIMYMLK